MKTEASLWLLITSALAGCSEPAPFTPDPICGTTVTVADPTCGDVHLIAGRLPDGLWIGSRETVDPTGNASCAEVRIDIEDNEIMIDTIWPDIQSLTWERWEFVTNNYVQILNHRDETIGQCACTLSACSCTYESEVVGQMTWNFHNNLVEFSDQMSLKDGDETYTSSALAELLCED